MNIPDKYRDRYDALAEEHPWMSEMVDEPCTSEDEKVQGLPDDNVLYLLRYVAKKSDGHTLYHGMTKLMQAIGREPVDRHETGSELAVALNTLADMVERDYVRRDGYDFVVDALKYMKAERDELKAQQESEFTMCIDCRQQARAEYDQLKAERDEWKAKYLGAMNDAEDYKTLWQRSRECSSKVRAGSSKSAKRAAAVDRLRNFESSDDGDGYYWDVTWSLLGKRPTEYDNSNELLSALIDLLTDDESCRQYADQGERDKTPDYESDSREKLEADVRERMEIFERNGTLVFADDVFEWLDRQAAIEKRRCFDGIAEHQAENLKLQGRIRELEAEREMYRDLCSQMLDAMDEVRAKVDASFPRGAKEVM